MIQRDRRSRIAGDYRKSWMEPLDEPAEQGRNAARDLGFATLAVGKAGIVGDVDERCIGQQLSCRREHRQAADAGIKEENGGGWIHNPSVAWCVNGRKLRRRSGLLRPARWTAR